MDFVDFKNCDVHKLGFHVNVDVLQVGFEQYAKLVHILLLFYSQFGKVINTVELESLIRQHVDDITISDFNYAYPIVMEDLMVHFLFMVSYRYIIRITCDT